MSPVKNVKNVSTAMVFSRGDLFKCTITYNADQDTVVFHDVVYPFVTEPSVMKRFFEDALTAFYKKFDTEFENPTAYTTEE